jgi:hypothetical protein
MSMPDVIFVTLKDFWNTISTFHNEILAVATFFIAAFTVILACIARRQIKDARILHRAYVSVKPLGIHIMKNKPDIIAHLAFVNVGHLPANNLRNEVKIKWSDDGNLNDFDSVKITDPSIILLPKTEIQRGTGPLSTAGAAQFRAKKEGFIYVWGRVEYVDGFKKRRWLIFCHRYNSSSERNIDGGIDAIWGRHHHHHNNGN